MWGLCLVILIAWAYLLGRRSVGPCVAGVDYSEEWARQITEAYESGKRDAGKPLGWEYKPGIGGVPMCPAGTWGSITVNCHTEKPR